jgi:hypothetical protein
MTMYGRDDETWDRLTQAGLEFLIQRARLGKVTSYTELNATLVRRTGFAGFDFDRADERAAMGHLLGLEGLRVSTCLGESGFTRPVSVFGCGDPRRW